MKFMEAGTRKLHDRRAERLPEWLKKRVQISDELIRVKNLIKHEHLNTVCQAAGCPNIVECFQKPTATFMILGNVCTRHCRFCGVMSGKPDSPDADEPTRIGRVVRKLNLKHIVITSVTRDDLQDGGASHFAETINAIHASLPNATIEALIPDFNGDVSALRKVVKTPLHVLNHNIETVPRLYQSVRPEANYLQSLEVLRTAKTIRPGLITKSGLMVGLGETVDELKTVFEDLAQSGVDALTIGQYMAPDENSIPVNQYIHPDQFKQYENIAHTSGIRWVKADPLVRSSYNAEELLNEIKGDVCE